MVEEQLMLVTYTLPWYIFPEALNYGPFFNQHFKVEHDPVFILSRNLLADPFLQHNCIDVAVAPTITCSRYITDN